MKLSKNPREVIKTIAPNHIVMSSIKELPWPLKNRQFISENTWMKAPDEGFVFAFRPPMSDIYSDRSLVNVGENTRSQLVRAKSSAFAIIKRIGEHSNDMCQVIYVQRADFMGNIPPIIMEKQIPRALQAAFQVREKFSRDDEIDIVERDKLLAIMRNGDNVTGGEVYDESETRLINKVQKQMEKASNDAFRPLNR